MIKNKSNITCQFEVETCISTKSTKTACHGQAFSMAVWNVLGTSARFWVLSYLLFSSKFLKTVFTVNFKMAENAFKLLL